MKSTNIDTLKSNDSTVTCYIYGKSNRDIDPIGVIDLEIKLLILLLLVPVHLRKKMWEQFKGIHET